MTRIILMLAVFAAPALHAQRAQTDEDARYELPAPETASFRVGFEVSVTAPGGREYVDRVRPGTELVSASAVDLMTGAALAVRKTVAALTVALARPVRPAARAVCASRRRSRARRSSSKPVIVSRLERCRD